MIHHRIMLMAGIAALAAPGIAHAEGVAQRVNINANVVRACGMGEPVDSIINLQDLTDDDGKLKSALKNAAPSGSTIIADAWCNAPHTLSLKATPMVLQSTPSYAQPAYMSRKLIYRAMLSNWIAGQKFGIRILGGNDTTSNSFDSARAGQGDGLTLEISELGALDRNGGENNNLMLETSNTGEYRGTVTITLTTP